MADAPSMTISLWYIPTGAVSSTRPLFNSYSDILAGTFEDSAPGWYSGDDNILLKHISTYVRFQCMSQIWVRPSDGHYFWIGGTWGFQHGTGFATTWRHLIIAIDATGNTNLGAGYAIMNGTRLLNYNGGVYDSSTVPGLGQNPIGFAGTPWNIKFNGNRTGLPNIPEELGTYGALKYADVQVWFGRFIDPTLPSNFAKFVTITGSKGYPVNPSVAATAFGVQTILFKGKASDASFWVNRGTGGTFTKTGTITDFTPAPSYG